MGGTGDVPVPASGREDCEGGDGFGLVEVEAGRGTGGFVSAGRGAADPKVDSGALHFGQTVSDSFPAILHFLQYFMRDHPACPGPGKAGED